jgi:hypothetical protein
MSVNPDGMRGGMGMAEEFVDLEHQVIRQKIDVVQDTDNNVAFEALPGSPGAEFDPGERQLDREEVAQLVYYRRVGTINFLRNQSAPDDVFDAFAIVDASVGINGDLFREVTTQSAFGFPDPEAELFVDTGGEIGLLDNYQLFAQPLFANRSDGTGSGGGVAQSKLYEIDFYNWPTGGPIVDSFDTITCGFGGNVGSTEPGQECQIELRYDFWWDVAEQGRQTNPFGRPSTR